MPTLVLLRHAQAESNRADDHARALSGRGRADAVAVRQWLTDQGIVPDRAVVSSSRRTRETWELVGAAADDVACAVTWDDRVYEASTEDLREVVAETDPEIGTLLLVGHNPSVERLAWELDDSEVAREQTDRGLPTSGVAVFEVAGWDLSEARLTAVAARRG